MPVIKHYHGVCHVYVDDEADLDMAERIAFNAKCQRPGVCNAMETLLLHRDVSEAYLRKAAPRFQRQGVEIRADETAYSQLSTLNYQPLRRAGGNRTGLPSIWTPSCLFELWTISIRQ